MQRKSLFWFLISAACLAGAAYFWNLGDKWQAEKSGGPATANQPGAHNAATTGKTPLHAFAPGGTNASSLAAKKAAPNPLRYRLTNSTATLTQLIHNDKAILLANALIDTTKPMSLAIPDRLKTLANGGSYLVQSRGPLNDQFRAAIVSAGGSIISYIPNNAYLVRISDSGVAQISANPQTQSVLAYQPYYKLDASTLQMAMEQPDSVPPNGVRVTIFPDAYQSTLTALQQMGAIVTGQDKSPFGPVLNVEPAQGTLSAVASLPGVQLVSALHRHLQANDLLRPTLGGSVDSLTNVNYMNLSGKNVLININDGGVDGTHPDLTNRLTSDFPFLNLFDTSGHGTHVTGTILGDGAESTTVTPVPQGSATNGTSKTAGPLVFRGMATNAQGFVMSFNEPDSYLQENAARTNAFISNNSWNYAGDASYDIAAASYDAAVRDAIPEVPGEQPLLFVFSAGNDGGASDNGTGGDADTILSPATAKNVITVGAVEQLRRLTNFAVANAGTSNAITNEPFFNDTDSSDQVAFFSSRGNVGVSVEGTAGRFKPDLVAPGTFVISDRSQEWNTNAYYNPTNELDTTLANINVTSNALVLLPGLFIEPNDVGIEVSIVTNRFSPDPFPNLPIYVAVNRNPTTNNFDFAGIISLTNGIFLPTNGVSPLSPFSTITIGIANPTNAPVNFDVLIQVFQTNDTGYFVALSNLNQSLNTNGGPDYYRYESGTSMAAAGVSGMLADMQEFFQKHTDFLTFSPALMKALLINGANPLDDYDLEVNTPLNSQGWGVPSLTNSIPSAWETISASNRDTLPTIFRDQSIDRALGTGQSNSFRLHVTPDAAFQDLRFTLVWTDPPGNPAAGTKLVNDLDLIVSNDVTGDIFYGNDILAGNIYNELGNTNAPNVDSVNNVENVFIEEPLAGEADGSASFTVTVFARRVNVNAVPDNTNGVVQDYALVISSVANPGEPGVTNAFDYFAATNNAEIPLANDFNNIIGITNGVPLFNQRVGGNPQFVGGTNFANGTNGLQQQWNFYVYTNTVFLYNQPPTASNQDYTNVAFVTFSPPELGVPRMEASGEIGSPDPGATRFAGSDVDLYVSADPNLTNLDPTAIANALKSTTRTGTEKVLITDAPASNPSQIYYIGIKSEAQQGAQYDFLAVATDQPFDQTDQNGNTIVTILTPLPVIIPPGGPSNPQHALVLGVSTSPAIVRKTVVTNTVTHQEFGDLIGTLTHETAAPQTAVLNNHTFFTNLLNLTNTFIYDDSGENDIPGSRTSDGPGTLRNFTGDHAADGIWRFVMVNDSSLSDTGAVLNFVIQLQPQPPASGFFATIQPNSYFYDFVDIPADATNLTVSVSQNTAPVGLYFRYGDFPTTAIFDISTNIPVGGGALTISKYSNPPLNAGREYFGIYNPNATAVTVFVVVQVGISINPLGPGVFTSLSEVPILDDAVTGATNHVTSDSQVVSADVGVRIDHPRESDLVLTLVSPQGTRVLLAENRGGLDTNGYGSGINITNVLPQPSAGGPSGNTNFIALTNTTGTIQINYDFFELPDDMRIYYQGALIYDTGSISGPGAFSVDYGPGTATNIEIIMDAPGANFSPDTNDMWTYTPTIITKDITYAFFTENTNLTTLPIKFAVPPFGGGNTPLLPATNVLASSFEGVPATNYPPGSFVDGWQVLVTNTISRTATNAVTVVTVPAFADNTNTVTGVQNTNVLALHKGAISRILPTVPGRSYTLIFANHGRPSLDPTAWYKAENSSVDSASNFDGILENGAGFTTNGEVGSAFTLNGINQYVRIPNAPQLVFTNRMTAETWVNPSAIGQIEAIISKFDAVASANQSSYALELEPSGQPYFFINSIGNDSGPATASATVTAPNPIPLNQWTYLAATFDGIAMRIYVNGLLQATTNFNKNIFPGENDLGLGANLGGENTTLTSGGSPAPFDGSIDEASLYNTPLTDKQIQDIYAAGSAGKCPVSGGCAVTATVLLGDDTKTITGIDDWTTNFYTFTAPTNDMVLTIIPNTNADGTIQDGMLLDSFVLTQNATPNPTNYYLPEESLAKLAGEPAKGDWKLEILDNRVGATNPQPMLISWELSLTLADRIPFAIPLQHAIPQTNTVAANSIVYYQVTVPPWAQFATNTLTTISGGPLTLLFNQNTTPTGTNSGDYSFGTPAPVLTTVLSSNSTPPLVPGATYFLGVQNTTGAPAAFSIEVDFNITTLTNGVSVTNTVLAGGQPQYYQFDILSNSVAADFQVLNPNGDVEMVVSKGPPLPDPLNFDYFSDGTSSQTITVLTNTTPVALGPGRWYIGIFNNAITTVKYTVVAWQAGPPTIVPLTNDVPLTFNSGPGPALTNFFVFAITNTNSAALFELYNLSGNVDLSLQRGVLPYGEPFFGYSGNGGKSNEQIVIRTNILGTNINDNWYLGVPNNTAGVVTYKIHAVVATNGLLPSEVPITPVISLPPAGSLTGPTLIVPTVQGEMYELQSAPSPFGPWTTIDTFTAGSDMSVVTDPNPVGSSPGLFYRVIQVPSP